MKLQHNYTSIGCNRTPECADWSSNGLIAFGACNAVGIFDPQCDGNSAKIMHTFVKHSKRVNTVRWLRSRHKNPKEGTYFLSGADDGLAVLWEYDSEKNELVKHFVLKGHTSGVYAVDGVQLMANDTWLLATAAADSMLKLWYFDGKTTCEEFQTISLNSGFGFSVRLVQIPQTNNILLAFSSDDESIGLWAQTSTTKDENGMRQFQLAHKLTGHEDWVRGLDFVATQDNDLLLASCSQDNFIRLWRISPRTNEQVLNNPVDLFHIDALEEIRVEEKIVQLGQNAWHAISLESVLFGHEGWVYGVHWHNLLEQGLHLLSSSIDKTLIIWETTEDGVWMEKVRVGEVGGNSLGFFGGKFSADGKSILGHSYQGGFHIWTQSAQEQQQHNWLPSIIVGGHFADVRDLAWEPAGQYLMTVSADQTTRIHAPWLRSTKCNITWHELARPQVHGYDMQALAILNRYKFASGAEEKIVRTFEAPLNFIENFRQLTRLQLDTEGDKLLEKLPKGASVPSLGLSNKAVYTLDTEKNSEVTVTRHIKDAYPEHYFVPVSLSGPPQEETLMQNTLWPEVQKLYGHGYEIYALAATTDGTLLASSCRATNAEHAKVILWNTANWKQVQKLASHQLTVTQMRFSPNGQYLLSVSRDRRWSLFKRENAHSMEFILSAATDKTNGVHTRIIWSCDWSPDCQSFVTSSRDGKAVIWSKCEQEEKDNKLDTLNGWHPLTVLELKNESITAVAFAPQLFTELGYVIIAMGFESGKIHLYKVVNKLWTLLIILNNDQAHHLSVRKLQFRPIVNTEENSKSRALWLASCGEDHMVRIHELYI